MRSSPASGYIHTLNRLPHTHNGGDTGIIASMEDSGNIAYRTPDIVFGSKTGPYSDQDGMLIYSGIKSECSRFDTLPRSVQRVFLGSAMRIAEYLQQAHESAILDEDVFLLIGMNTAIAPGKGQVQSIRNPHFHTGLLSMIDETNRTNSTEVVPVIDTTNTEHQRAFCIRENNYLLRDSFISGKSGWRQSILYSMDYPLSGDGLVSEKNMTTFHRIYTQAWSHIRGTDIAGNRRNRGFSIGLVYELGRWVVRIAFFEKANTSDSGGSGEMSGHAIRRVEVSDVSDVADTREFADRVATCLRYPYK